MNKVFIIAEAGVNHNGDIEVAKKMIDVASESGVDAIKFQSFKAENLVCKNAEKAEYQKQTTDSEETQFEMIKKLELDQSKHEELIKYCNEKGVMFLSSPFDLESIDLLNSLGVEIFKIPSGEIENVPYLEKIGQLNKKVILSTGMCSLADIEFAINILKNSGTNDVTVLHCNTEYPTPMKDVNLSAMNTIKEAFKIKVGYSDHTKGIEVPIAAVALGAEVIEKHFTIDKQMEGPDHRASLDPAELKAMVKSIRNIEVALGDGVKKPSSSETKNIGIVRKSIVAGRRINKGEIFTEENITVKRPGNGVSPKMWHEIIGETALKDYCEDELIKL